MIRRRHAEIGALVVAALAAGAALLAEPAGRTVTAARLVAALAAAEPAPPADIERTEIAYAVDGRAYRADLWRAGDGGAPLVLVPGAARRGRDDPRLRAFAGALAEAGFAVLVPGIESLRALRIGPGDVTPIADAVRHLAERSGRPEVGLAAISYAAGPAVLAALETRAAPRTGFVLAIGGYHDVRSVVTYVTTGHYRAGPDKPWRTQTPNPYGRLVLALSNIPRLAEARDRALFREIVRRRLADPEADVADLSARLGGDGRALWALLANRDPDRVPALIAALPGPMRDAFAALDLSRRDLSDLRARLILVHGRDDPLIPWTESAALADAAPADRTRLFIVPRLAHVTVGETGLRSAWVMFRAAWALLAARDALAPAK